MHTQKYIECPHCRICSIKLTAKEYHLVKNGQQMIEVCQVCGSEFVIDDRSLKDY